MIIINDIKFKNIVSFITFNYHEIIDYMIIWRVKKTTFNDNFKTHRYIFQLLFSYLTLLREKNSINHLKFEIWNLMFSIKIFCEFSFVFQLCESFSHVVNVSCSWMIRFWSKSSLKYCFWSLMSMRTKRSLFWLELSSRRKRWHFKDISWITLNLFYLSLCERKRCWCSIVTKNWKILTSNWNWIIMCIIYDIIIISK